MRKLKLALDIFWFAGVFGCLLLLCSEYIFLLLPQGRHGVLLIEPNFAILSSEVAALLFMLTLTLIKIVKWLKGIGRNA